MMEQTWTTKQVVTFLMAMATGLHFVSPELNQETSFQTLDRLLTSCVEEQPPMAMEERHLQIFQESLEPGFFQKSNEAIVQAELNPESFHQDVMQLPDDSFITLVANLSEPLSQKLKLREGRNSAIQKGL